MATLALEQTKIPPTQLEMSAWTPRNNKKFNVKVMNWLPAGLCTEYCTSDDCDFVTT